MNAPVQEGDVLAHKYRVERVIGQGGMGVVVAAVHEQLGTRVALKFLLPPATESEESVTRFLREAQAAVRIQSEHVARVLDVGTLENGAPYLVMEYLNGLDLAHVLQARGPLPIDEAVGYVLQACEAVAEAHSVGIVHRDLKPANVFVTERADGSPLVKVLAFGISKSLKGSPGSASLTATTTIMGSPAYMSPEQVRSAKHVTERSDVWSLGVVVYELVSGRHPFEGDSTTSILASVCADPPVPLRRVLPGAPETLERIILECLEKDPKKRTASVADLAGALAPFSPRTAMVSVERILGLHARAHGATLPGSQPGSGPAAPGSGTLVAPAGAFPPAAPAGTGRAWGSTARQESQSRGRTLAIAGVGAALLVAGTLGVMSLRSPRAVPSATPAAFADGAHATPPAAPPPVASTATLLPPAAAVVPPAPVVAAAAPSAALAPVPETPVGAGSAGPAAHRAPPSRVPPHLSPSSRPAEDLFDDVR
jgi:serine/threonine-protein kinase